MTRTLFGGQLPSKAPFSKRFEEEMGMDEIYLGKKQKFLTVVSNLQTGEPLWFGGAEEGNLRRVFPERAERISTGQPSGASFQL